MHRIVWAIAAAAVLTTSNAAVAPSASAEEVLRAVTAFNRNVRTPKSFLRFVDVVNREMKGALRIDYAGGPEVIPPREQAVAVRNGAIDIVYAPPNFYLGIVPEGGALGASDKTPMEVRANGGFAMLADIMRKKLNSHFLAWSDAGLGFHIFLTKKPKMMNGSVDLSGLKLRSTPITNKFFSGLGATNVQMFIGDIYSALERGLIDGLGTPLFVVNDFSWDKFIKYRIDPGFLQVDIATVVNLDKWNALPEASRAKLQSLAIENEKISYDAFQKDQQALRAEQAKRGLETITLKGEAARKFRAAAFENLWADIKRRSPDMADQLRAKFYN